MEELESVNFHAGIERKFLIQAAILAVLVVLDSFDSDAIMRSGAESLRDGLLNIYFSKSP